MFRLGYNTNGLAHHRVLDALDLLADLGYEGVALTPDVGGLDPLRPSGDLAARVRRRARDLGLELTVETGARFVLDPRRKHYPTLMEDRPRERARRVDFLRRSIDLAVELEARLVSLWAGAAPEGETVEDPALGAGERERLLDRLAGGLELALDHARASGVALAFEPEPGMFVERPAGFGALVEHMGAGAQDLGLCLDVGHLLVTGDLPVAAAVRDWRARLVHVHLDDIAGGLHEHRMFGEGELDLEETLSALISVGYDGMAAVELSRDSHRGASAAREAMVHLRSALARLT